MRVAALATASALLAGLLFALGYEVYETRRYERWRAAFTQTGWLGKITEPSENPVLLWEYRPNASARGIHTNRYGFRDVDYETPAKPPGVFRVAFVGDSVTLGMRLPEEQIFVRRFQERVKEVRPSLRLQALNFGVDGYNAFQIRELVRSRALSFEPDRVVYVLCLNDFDRGGSAGQKMLYFRRPKSFFLERLDRAWQKLFDVDFHLLHYRRNGDAVFEALAGMRDLAEARGVHFEVVIVPAFYRASPGFEEYPPRPVHEALGRFLAESRIEAFDLLAPFQALGVAPAEISRDGWHPNARGHGLIARLLAERFAARTAP